MASSCSLFFFFFFKDTAAPEIYTLALHDALPISRGCAAAAPASRTRPRRSAWRRRYGKRRRRSEEHTSELQSRLHLVCRPLLERTLDSSHTTNSSRISATGACGTPRRRG